MPLSAGDRLGPYEILAPIGKGGMGEVYRAHDSRLKRDVAIKVSAAQFSERFEREAQAIAALNHPNICQLYDVGPNYLVMEYIEGTPLKGPLPVDQALKYAAQICDALDAAHKKGITHRDLKPANILVTKAGIKLLDFGLAKLATSGIGQALKPDDATLTMALTGKNEIVGTLYYMSPEQLQAQANGQEIDGRSDIFSFGLVLYEMLTGKRAFEGSSPASVIAAIMERPAPSIAEIAPPALDRLLKRCLAKDPDDRWQSARDLKAELEWIASAPESASAPPAIPVPRHRSWLPWCIAAFFLLALMPANILHFREEPPRLVQLQLQPPEKGSFDQANGPPAVSPDGRRIAFPAIADGKNMLWVRDLDSLVTRALAGTENGSYPFWSPDSRNLGFFAGGKMMKIDVMGGSAITIANNTPNPRGATWNRNDVIAFAPKNGGSLARVSAAGGTATPVTEMDASRNEGSHRLPWFLPDGRHFLYTARSNDPGQTAIFAGDLESVKSKKLVLQAASNVQYAESSGGTSGGNGYLLFMRERTLVAQPFDAGALTTTGEARPVAEQVDVLGGAILYGYFSASLKGVLAYASGGSGGLLQIIGWHDRSGKVVGTVGKPADMQTPRLSPDGKTVAVDRLDASSGNYDIWLHDVARATEQRLTFTGNNQWPVWSPDGMRIAYLRRTDAKVMVRAANGTGAEEILEAAQKAPMDWTRDGGFLLSATLASNPKTANDIWAMPLSGKDRKPLALRQTEFSEWHARVSPDGRWMAYRSNESKRPEVYVVGFPALNGKWQVSANGGQVPVWSRDGRELYFVGADNKLMAVPITPGPQFQPGIPQPLFDVRLGNNNPSYDVSADGRFLIATPVEQSATVPMTVVLNWQQALKK